MNKQQLRNLIQEEIKKVLREFRPDMTDDNTHFSGVFKDSDSKAATFTFEQGKDVTFVLTDSTKSLDINKLKNNDEIKKAIGEKAINLIIQKVESGEMDNAINHAKSANRSNVLIITSPDIDRPYVSIK